MRPSPMRFPTRRTRRFALCVSLTGLLSTAEAIAQGGPDEWHLDSTVNAIDLNCPGQNRTDTESKTSPGQVLTNIAGAVVNISTAGCEGTSDAHVFARLRRLWMEAQHDLNSNSPANRCGAADASTVATGVGTINWPGRAPGTPLPGELLLRLQITGELRASCTGFAFARSEYTSEISFIARQRADGSFPPDIPGDTVFQSVSCTDTVPVDHLVDFRIGPDPANRARVGDKWDYRFRFLSNVSSDALDVGTHASATNTFSRPLVFCLKSFVGTRFGFDAGGDVNVLPLFDFGGPDDCMDGTVNSAQGPVTDVLFVNNSTGGESRSLTIARRAPITVRLNAAPQGPSAGATYWFWLWTAPPSNPVDLVVDGRRLGCTVNPTPFDIGLSPQPFRCFHSAETVPPGVCASVPRLNVPASADFAPWTLTRATGFARPMTLALQGVLEDFGAGNDSNLSVTNALKITIQ